MARTSQTEVGESPRGPGIGKKIRLEPPDEEFALYDLDDSEHDGDTVYGDDEDGAGDDDAGFGEETRYIFSGDRNCVIEGDAGFGETRDEEDQEFDRGGFSSRSTKKSFEVVWDLLGKRKDVTFIVPSKTDRAWAPPEGFVCLYEAAVIDGGLRLPLPSLFVDYCAARGIAFTQLTVNSVVNITGLLEIGRDLGTAADIEFLEEATNLSTNAAKPRIFFNSMRPRADIVINRQNKLRNWEESYFFMEVSKHTMPDPNATFKIRWSRSFDPHNRWTRGIPETYDLLLRRFRDRSILLYPEAYRKKCLEKERKEKGKEKAKLKGKGKVKERLRVPKRKRMVNLAEIAIPSALSLLNAVEDATLPSVRSESVATVEGGTTEEHELASSDAEETQSPGQRKRRRGAEDGSSGATHETAHTEGLGQALVVLSHERSPQRSSLGVGEFVVAMTGVDGLEEKEAYLSAIRSASKHQADVNALAKLYDAKVKKLRGELEAERSARVVAEKRASDAEERASGAEAQLGRVQAESAEERRLRRAVVDKFGAAYGAQMTKIRQHLAHEEELSKFLMPYVQAKGTLELLKEISKETGVVIPSERVDVLEGNKAKYSKLIGDLKEVKLTESDTRPIELEMDGYKVPSVRLAEETVGVTVGESPMVGSEAPAIHTAVREASGTSGGTPTVRPVQTSAQQTSRVLSGSNGRIHPSGGIPLGNQRPTPRDTESSLRPPARSTFGTTTSPEKASRGGEDLRGGEKYDRRKSREDDSRRQRDSRERDDSRGRRGSREDDPRDRRSSKERDGRGGSSHHGKKK